MTYLESVQLLVTLFSTMTVLGAVLGVWLAIMKR